ncbi:MAG: sugar phosphate isomerase/epimerase, partial [bacterium]|nr:sugar phosphate isomerase/epimerase [bacterium]
SLRYDAAKDLPGTLALIRKMGFEEVEVSGFNDRSAAEYRRLLDDSGLKATSLMADYERLDKEVSSVADEAHQLGAEYVVCSTIPHKSYLTMEECRRGAEFLDRAGEVLAGSKLRGCYHIHGTEFRSSPDGTMFDTLLKLTDPKLTNFEMDIFWVVYASQDPVDFLHRYPGRFPLLHVKDIRKGTELGLLPRDVREEDSVPLGQGIVDLPPALLAAQETGVRHYYIEDEAVDAAKQIPESLRYLKNIRW